MALLFIATQGSQAQELYVTLAALPVLLLQHSNIRFDFGILNSLFNTNALHRWHHSTNPQEGCQNLGRPKLGPSDHVAAESNVLPLSLVPGVDYCMAGVRVSAAEIIPAVSAAASAVGSGCTPKPPSLAVTGCSRKLWIS